ncbi:hypothetical protein ACFL4Q_02300 [candidate division KSB1 bacterium]
MRLISVNVSLPRNIVYRNRKIITSIFKKPVEGRVRLARRQERGKKSAVV